MKVKLTVTGGECRSGYCKVGDEFTVEDICPPICHELWNCAYPMVYALINGAKLECGDKRVGYFDVKCPDGGRVTLHGEAVE